MRPIGALRALGWGLLVAAWVAFMLFAGYLGMTGGSK